MLINDLGLLPYQAAWDFQEQVHSTVVAGEPEQILLVEHPPVITFGRRPGREHHLLASVDQLAKAGVEVIHSDRGGDITFHGPGQLVAYPIIRLAGHFLSVSAYVHLLEDAVIDTLAVFNISAQKDPAAIGVWTQDGQHLAKIAAIGVRIRQGVTLHGLALNVATDLNFFKLIVPCGLPDRPVTSLQKLLAEQAPSIQETKKILAATLIERLNRAGKSEIVR